MTASQLATWQSRASLVMLTCYWALLFAGTHVPRLQPILVMRNSDKVLHAAAYAGLAFLLALAWSRRRTFGMRQMLAVLAILAVYAGFDETTQPLVGRTADWADWVADVSGTLAGLAVFAGVRAVWRRAMTRAVG
jgi:VanZ family protein